MLELGFTGQELSFLDFLNQYYQEYSRVSSQLLSPEAVELFPSRVHTAIAFKLSDGYLVLYEPGPAEYLAKLPIGSDIDVPDEGLVVLNSANSSISETIQGLTYNSIKLAMPSPTQNDCTNLQFPEDNPQAVDWQLSPELRERSMRPPQIQVMALPTSEGLRDAEYGHSRIRLIAPVVSAVAGEGLIRAFTWLFADIWLGDIGWDHTVKGVAEALAVNDALAVNQLSSLVHPLGETIQIDPERPLSPIESRIEEFKALIEQEDVAEVRDVLPFLSRPENRFLLSPTCVDVWPEKMLGNKWRVDFLLREPGNLYTAMEIESPTKRLYKAGKNVEPYAEFHHAEQQVRDYCNLIDHNLGYVEREEDLAGIFRPNGVVVIGRRATLSAVGARKLRERNADGGRYVVKTFDDLIEQAEAMVKRLEAVI